MLQPAFPNAELQSADGALEAAPKMGYADIILDLVSTGTTLRENNLKELEGARMLESEGVLVASRKAMETNPTLLAVLKELLERLEAHLEANKFYTGERQAQLDWTGLDSVMLTAGLPSSRMLPQSLDSPNACVRLGSPSLTHRKACV